MAGELTKVTLGLTTDAQIDFETYEYSLNGQKAAVIDAKGTVVSVSRGSDAFEIQVARGKTIISRTAFDGVVKGGVLLKTPLLSNMTLFARPGFAVVAIAVTGGVTRVLRVGADGKITPITVVRT